METQRYLEKSFLQKLATLLGIPQSLIKDVAGSWIIKGRSGNIRTDGVSWHVVIACHSKRAWSAVKRKLHFMSLVDDVGDAGTFCLDRMPTCDEAPIIRKLVGLKKKPELTDEYRKSLAERLNRKTEQIAKKGAVAPSTGVFHPHEVDTSTKADTGTHNFVKASSSWSEEDICENRQTTSAIEVLRRCKFIGKLHPWKANGEKEIIGLLVPVETALAEVRAVTHQSDLTRTDLLRLLKVHNVSVFSNIDQFAKEKELSRNAGIVRQTRKNARAGHSIYA